MSISRFFDAWMADRDIVPEAEIVPDHACQVFLPCDGVRISPAPLEGETHHTDVPDLEAVRSLVEEQLG